MKNVKIADLEEYRRQNQGKGARITFHSSRYATLDGQAATLNVSIEVTNGDAFGVLEVIREEGGIWSRNDDGKIYFLPWPCAAVEVEIL
jgi:hypothetical protein